MSSIAAIRILGRRSLATAPRMAALGGTKFSEREAAAEAAYIRKHEEQLRQLKSKNTDEVKLDKTEVESLMNQAKRPHVKELLRELHAHM